MKTNIFTLGFILTFFISCNYDKGNYDYIDIDEILPENAVEGIEDTYSRSSQEYLNITPKLVELDEDDYDYCWYLYGINSTVYARDTISKTKELNFFITLSSGTYRLFFKATNKKNGLALYKTTVINVASIYSNGWYILKKEDNSSDLDLIDIEGKLHSSIIQTVNNKPILGNPIKISSARKSYNHLITNEDGTVKKLQNQDVIFLVTDKDLAVLNLDNMNIFNQFDNLFYEAPDVKAPQNVFTCYGGPTLINNGKAHWISNIRANSGLFNAPIIGDYSFSSYGMSYFVSGALVHDKISNSFKVATPYSTTITDITSEKLNKPFDVLYMKEQAINSMMIISNGLALVRDIETNVLKGVRLNTDWSYGGDPVMDAVDIPLDRNIYNGKIFALNNNNNVLYYSEGKNKLNMYNILSTQENLNIVTYPDNEAIKSINHMSVLYSSNSFDQLAVLTSTGNGWKLYLYNFVGTTSEIVTPEIASYSGTGEPQYVTYLSSDILYVN